MHKITAWKAQRSSTSMTIVGKDEVGQVLKVAHVVSIEGAAPYPIATDINGLHYQLVCDGADVLAGVAPTDTANAIAA
ncbi:MAG: hypothetical protein EOP20_00705 [Hyphomicrobiales bacterium]|nr:MAG: hypothetical protein EOP20_00705 [Hyphomicrobiales bacterium]